MMNTRILSVCLLAVALTATSGAAEAGCNPFPKVPWWGQLTHGMVIRYVRDVYRGDWNRHIRHYEDVRAKLVEIRDENGTVVIKGTDVRLSDAEISDYIAKVDERIEITRCLARFYAQPLSLGSRS
jgi:hypothetical protein